jgi:hypothetical protein
MSLIDSLYSIEGKLSDPLRQDLRRRINTAGPVLFKLAGDLKRFVDNNLQIKENLFQNNQEVLYYSGDILAKTFYDYYLTGEGIDNIFIENVERTKYTYNIPDK